MGCVNTNSKTSPQKNHSNQEFQIPHSWKIKCLEPKISKIIANQHMRTHDSLAQDYSIELSGHHPFSPHHESQSIDLVEVKRKRNSNIENESMNDSTVKIRNQFLVNGQKYDQTTFHQEEIVGFPREEQRRNKRNKRDYEKQESIIKKVLEISDSTLKKGLRIQHQKQDNIDHKNTNNKVQRQRSLEGKVKQEQNNGHQRSKKCRAKRLGFRSPRGRSCNLFKTFEDDYIQDENIPETIKKESMSMGQLQN